MIRFDLERIGRLADGELCLHRAERMRDGEVAQASGSDAALARVVRLGLGLRRRGDPGHGDRHCRSPAPSYPILPQTAGRLRFILLGAG